MWYKNKVEVPGEVIYEIITKEDNVGFGLALAEIQESRPHYHKQTLEIYVALSGALAIYFENKETGGAATISGPGGSFVIPKGIIHYAKSLNFESGAEPARIIVITIPARSPEDHFLSP